MNSKIVAQLVAAGIVSIALAACSSSSSTSTHASASASSTRMSTVAPGDGHPPATETFTSGKVTSAKVLNSNSPTVQLMFTGPVVATGSVNLGGSGPTKGQLHTFTTSKGNLVLQVVSDTSNTKLLSTKTCLALNVTTVKYTVVGSKSTGSFKSATGSGVVTVTFQANSELNGKCSTASNAEPTTMANAYMLLYGAGPLTVHS